MKKYNYKKLEDKLAEKRITRSMLSESLGISSKTLAKIKKGEKISDSVIKRISNYLNMDSSNIMCCESENMLLNILRNEKEQGISGGIYEEMQVIAAYNSNRIDGNRLTKEQIRYIFKTNMLDSVYNVAVDDIIETVNHFRAFDYVLRIAENELCEEDIKNVHRILRQSTRHSECDWFAVGQYKKLANSAGENKTEKPEYVSDKVKNLLKKYNETAEKTFFDIVEFHSEFEKIHPFQDGNGRVGRLISIKECLKIGIIPFIIEETKKQFYFSGLSDWESERGYLTDVCLSGQETIKKWIAVYDISI